MSAVLTKPAKEEKKQERCGYTAPFFAFCLGLKHYGLLQGCCNHWDCPRCGQMVARQHYGRIVAGARVLKEAGCKLAFVTMTCRGREMSREQAFANYLDWTNRVLDAMRAKATRKTKKHDPEFWSYVQVTEMQKRGLPHSHFLMTCVPDDTLLGITEKWTRERGMLTMHEVPTLRSEWLAEEVVKAGLGEQYDISEVEQVEAASRYVAKYMFKESQFSSRYPKRWRRVRYAQSWPQLPEQKTDAFVVMTNEDWDYLASIAIAVEAEAGDAHRMAIRHLARNGVIVYTKDA